VSGVLRVVNVLLLVGILLVLTLILLRMPVARVENLDPRQKRNPQPWQVLVHLDEPVSFTVDNTEALPVEIQR
jgi:hypothetical protein